MRAFPTSVYPAQLDTELTREGCNRRSGSGHVAFRHGSTSGAGASSGTIRPTGTPAVGQHEGVALAHREEYAIRLIAQLALRQTLGLGFDAAHVSTVELVRRR